MIVVLHCENDASFFDIISLCRIADAPINNTNCRSWHFGRFVIGNLRLLRRLADRFYLLNSTFDLDVLTSDQSHHRQRRTSARESRSDRKTATAALFKSRHRKSGACSISPLSFWSGVRSALRAAMASVSTGLVSDTSAPASWLAIKKSFGKYRLRPESPI